MSTRRVHARAVSPDAAVGRPVGARLVSPGAEPDAGCHGRPVRSRAAALADR